MASNSVPKMVLHRPTGQACVNLRLPDGRRRMVYLGTFGSPEAQRRYREVLGQFLAGNTPSTAAAKAPPASEPLVSRLVLEYLLHARQEYRNEHGKLSRHVENMDRACGYLLAICRNRTVASITCNDLLALRAHLVAEPMENGQLRSRRYVNEVVGRVKMVFRWGTTVGLVPGSVWHALSALRALGPGRGGARETEPVEAVPRAMVDAILPHLPPHLQTAVEVLWWSGMRAGELCNLRMRDLERGEDVWIYRPARHKGSWKGRDRVVRFGPRCIELLRPLLKADPDAYLFSPAQVMAERFAARRAARKTKVQPGRASPTSRRARQQVRRAVRGRSPAACGASSLRRGRGRAVRLAPSTPCRRHPPRARSRRRCGPRAAWPLRRPHGASLLPGSRCDVGREGGGAVRLGLRAQPPDAEVLDNVLVPRFAGIDAIDDHLHELEVRGFERKQQVGHGPDGLDVLAHDADGLNLGSSNVGHEFAGPFVVALRPCRRPGPSEAEPLAGSSSKQDKGLAPGVKRVLVHHMA